MKLLKLQIKNFKGIETRVIEPRGESIEIYGDNALTKTSTLDAIGFILFERDIQNRSVQAFGIKPREKTEDGSLGEVIYGLEPSVSVELTLDSGTPLKIKKVHREKWEKQRGSNTERVTGYTIDYYWNTLDITYTEFKERWSKIIDDEVAKQLSLPDYVSERMSVAERRALLVSLIQYDDQNVIDAFPELADYFDILGGEDQAIVVESLKKKRTDLKKELGTRKTPGAIDARIDENQRKIKEVPEIKEVQSKIQELTGQKESLQSKISEIKAGGGLADLNVKIQEIESLKQKAVNDHQKTVDESLLQAREKVKELENSVDQADSELREAARQYESAKADVEEAESEHESIGSDIESNKSRTPDPKPEKQDPKPCVMGCPPECPDCGASLLEAAGDDDSGYEDYVMSFNAQKAETLKALRESFEQQQKEVDRLAAVLKEKEQDGAKARAKQSQRKDALNKAKAALEAQKTGIAPPDLSKYEKQQEALHEKVKQVKFSLQSSIDEIQSQIDPIDQLINDQNTHLQDHKANAEYRARIDELLALKRKTGDELTEVEDKLTVIENFNREKAKMIEGKVNKLFNKVNWRLFEIQNNGGLKEICDAVYNSNPWGDLSASEQIKCGIDIIETLSRHYRKSMPVLIDRQEGVTTLPNSDKQFIGTIVSKADKVLRIELAEKELAVA